MSASAIVLSTLFAESAAGARAAAATDKGETVVVTGQRRDEAVAKTPAQAAAVTAQDAATRINAVNTEDMLKYLPNIFVRKRHIGDIQNPITTRTSGVGASARSLIFADGILLSSLIGNNNATASPHWGLVAPEDVARIDVLYGPFSAQYAGNSIGAVVNITTRMPERFEYYGKTLAGFQDFSQYATRGVYRSYQAAAGLGSRSGPFAWRVSANYLDSHGQPLSYATLARPAAPSGSGAIVSGAYTGLNRTGAPIVIIGAGGLEHQRQATGTIRVTYDIGADWQLGYTASLFAQTDKAQAKTYLRNASGAPVYAGSVNIGGYAYTIPASAISNGVYDLKQTHLAQAVELKSIGDGAWSWDVVASAYDYLRDTQRSPTTALPAASAGGAGVLARMDGTGWVTLDGKASWTAGPDDSNVLSFGVHYDRVELNLKRFNTADWIAGGPGGLAAAAAGVTETRTLWLEDAWQFAPAFKATVGVRVEDWKAKDGFNYSSTPLLAVRQPALGGTFTSPKATLAWKPHEAWTVTASWGVAYHMPTVTELYQTVATGSVLSVPNPDLRPEHANSYDLSVQYAFEAATLRVSLFAEDIDDALISQAAPLLPGSTTLFNYVQNIDRVRSRGAELVVDGRDVFGSGIDLAGSVTYVDSEIAADPVFPAAVGKHTPQIPRWRATLSATWHASDRLALTLAGRYGSRSYGTIDNSDIVSNTYQGFDDYLVIDARARYEIVDGWSASLGIDNLNDDKSFLFHPFPQRTFVTELHYAY